MKTLRHIIVASVMCVAASTAQAHGKLVVSSPANGATLDRSPSDLRLQFNEPVEAAFTNVKLTDSSEQIVPTGPSVVDKADAKIIVLSLPPLQSGAYRAVWTMVGPDGHKVTGTVAFKVR